MPLSDERKAQNEAIFREANEQVRQAAALLPAAGAATPFICECEDAGCREIVQLDAAEYEAVRAEPTTFLIAPGHPSSTGELVTDHGRYAVVRKTGTAGRIAEATDPRSGDGRA